jgi:Icc-related predicted phosphoesterase
MGIFDDVAKSFRRSRESSDTVIHDHQKLRILAAADVHGDKKLVSRLADKAEKKKVDLVVLCGDLTFFETDVSGMIGPFREKDKKVIFVPGNHETLATADFLSKMYDKTYNLHGYSIMIGDVGFFGVGGGNVGIFDVDEAETKKLLKRALKGIRNAKKKVLVSHMPPVDTKLDNLGWTNAGSKSIREIIEDVQPDLCLCGHIHETFGEEEMIGKTRVINVGIKGKIIDI